MQMCLIKLNNNYNYFKIKAINIKHEVVWLSEIPGLSDITFYWNKRDNKKNILYKWKIHLIIFFF